MSLGGSFHSQPVASHCQAKALEPEKNACGTQHFQTLEAVLAHGLLEHLDGLHGLVEVHRRNAHKPIRIGPRVLCRGKRECTAPRSLLCGGNSVVPRTCSLVKIHWPGLHQAHSMMRSMPSLSMSATSCFGLIVRASASCGFVALVGGAASNGEPDLTNKRATSGSRLHTSAVGGLHHTSTTLLIVLLGLSRRKKKNIHFVAPERDFALAR